MKGQATAWERRFAKYKWGMTESKIKSKNKWVGRANDVALPAKCKATQSRFSFSVYTCISSCHMFRCDFTSLFAGEGNYVMVIEKS